MPAVPAHGSDQDSAPLFPGELGALSGFPFFRQVLTLLCLGSAPFQVGLEPWLVPIDHRLL